jgi:hypothetical protein
MAFMVSFGFSLAGAFRDSRCGYQVVESEMMESGRMESGKGKSFE